MPLGKRIQTGLTTVLIASCDVKVVEIGNHQELLGMNGVYAQLCKQGQGKATTAAK